MVATAYRLRRTKHAWQINSQVQIGLPIFSATRNQGGPDGEFVKWRLQGQWRQALSTDGRYQMLLAINAQWSNKPLLPLEIFSIGGINSVRGYRQSQFARDIGWSLSMNLPVTLMYDLEAVPFVDSGQAWNHQNQQKNTLVSVGLELNWRPDNHWLVNTYYARPLTETRKQGDSLQDDGVGFRVQYQIM